VHFKRAAQVTQAFFEACGLPARARTALSQLNLEPEHPSGPLAGGVRDRGTPERVDQASRLLVHKATSRLCTIALLSGIVSYLPISTAANKAVT
jgi:hypothetical protein